MYTHIHISNTSTIIIIIISITTIIITMNISIVIITGCARWPGSEPKGWQQTSSTTFLCLFCDSQSRPYKFLTRLPGSRLEV